MKNLAGVILVIAENLNFPARVKGILDAKFSTLIISEKYDSTFDLFDGKIVVSCDPIYMM